MGSELKCIQIEHYHAISRGKCEKREVGKSDRNDVKKSHRKWIVRDLDTSFHTSAQFV